jgi:Heterokaryon incompatibility protein (HET)
MNCFVPLHQYPKNLPLPPRLDVDAMITQLTNKGPTRFLKISPGWHPAAIQQQLISGLNRRTDQPPRYKHLHLDPSTDTIRVFILSPGEESTQIKGKLVHVSLEDRFAYEALSYTWGCPPDSKTILLDGEFLPATENLYSALLHLRDPKSPRNLWIDALCINQKDDAEKSIQVQRMKSIYQQASQVIIWLGPSKDDSDLAMDLINGRDLFSLPRPKFGPKSVNLRKMHAINLGDTIMLHDEGLNEQESIALYSLLCRPWWSRVWCMQEVAVSSSDPLIVCGHKSTPWSAYSAISAQKPDTYFPLGTWQSLWVRACEGNRDFTLSRDHFQSEHSSKRLSVLLRNTTHLRSTDARDKVYALLGIANEQDRQVLLPDYSKPLGQVLIETMAHILLSEGRLDLFSFVVVSQKHNRQSVAGLPSWVANWTVQLRPRRQIWSPGLYNACRGIQANLSLSQDKKVLWVDGLCVDTISYVSKEIRFEGDTLRAGKPHTFCKTITWLENWLNDIFKTLHPTVDEAANPDQWSRIQALNQDPHNSDTFWRTLIADRYTTQDNGHAGPVPSICSELFGIVRRGSSEFGEKKPERLDHLTRIFGTLKTEAPTMQNPLSYTMPTEDPMTLAINPLADEMLVLLGRCLFVTSSGYLGLASEGVKAGDSVTLLMGGDVPFLLRRRSRKPTHFRLVGEAYVHGIMYGEAIDGWKKGTTGQMMQFPIS